MTILQTCARHIHTFSEEIMDGQLIFNIFNNTETRPTARFVRNGAYCIVFIREDIICLNANHFCARIDHKSHFFTQDPAIINTSFLIATTETMAKMFEQVDDLIKTNRF